MAHINSFVRIPLLALRQKIKPLPRIGIFDEDRVRMRVWPNDIDFNLHLNNSRFLSCMDYSRMHLLASVGLLGTVVRNRWTPLVGSVWITYRRSLPLFKGFCISSRLVCWDERWFYMEQQFTSSEGLAAVAWVKAIFRDQNGNVPPQSVVETVAPGVVSPALPEDVLVWNDMTRDKLQRSQTDECAC